MSSLSALISSEARWAICSHSACSEAWDGDPSWAGHSLLTLKMEILLPPPRLWHLPVCTESQFASLTQLKVSIFAKVIFCWFSKWDWCAVRSGLCQSWLKVKRWERMAWEEGKSNRGLDGQLLILSKNCCNLCNDENLLWFSATVYISVVSLGEQWCPLLPETHVTIPG